MRLPKSNAECFLKLAHLLDFMPELVALIGDDDVFIPLLIDLSNEMLVQQFLKIRHHLRMAQIRLIHKMCWLDPAALILDRVEHIRDDVKTASLCHTTPLGT